MQSCESGCRPPRHSLAPRTQCGSLNPEVTHTLKHLREETVRYVDRASCVPLSLKADFMAVTALALLWNLPAPSGVGSATSQHPPDWWPSPGLSPVWDSPLLRDALVAHPPCPRWGRGADSDLSWLSLNLASRRVGDMPGLQWLPASSGTEEPSGSSAALGPRSLSCRCRPTGSTPLLCPALRLRLLPPPHSYTSFYARAEREPVCGHGRLHCPGEAGAHLLL